MKAYYNENDPAKAAWLRELIRRDLITPGDVDERSILDVFPGDLSGYTQCHFFAGVGVWSYSLRLAGWPDDRPVWTGSCPCQPFSAAGKRGGTADERHLWPYWHHLIRCGRPESVLGEQVSSPDGLGWWDLVSADLEAENYAPWAVDFSSAGVGAPIIRQRLYWMACANEERRGRRTPVPQGDLVNRGEIGWDEKPSDPCGSGAVLGMVCAEGARGCSGLRDCGQAGVRWVLPGDGDGIGGVGLPSREGLPPCERPLVFGERRRGEGRAASQSGEASASWSDATTGFWRDPDWLFCRDGKWRPVESSTFPLVNGAPARVGRLRGYGDAINVQAAKAFIEVVMEELPW